MLEQYSSLDDMPSNSGTGGPDQEGAAVHATDVLLRRIQIEVMLGPIVSPDRAEVGMPTLGTAFACHRPIVEGRPDRGRILRSPRRTQIVRRKPSRCCRLLASAQ